MPAQVRCPSCGLAVAWSVAEKFRPFCSERCRLIDLGDWASERYVVGGSTLADDVEIDSPPPQGNDA